MGVERRLAWVTKTPADQGLRASGADERDVHRDHHDSSDSPFAQFQTHFSELSPLSPQFTHLKATYEQH
jgi:hypothetical protein